MKAYSGVRLTCLSEDGFLCGLKPPHDAGWPDCYHKFCPVLQTVIHSIAEIENKCYTK
ncbi:hypothetical protein BRYFOR_07928 [Marvinbryantia formatexigens DSM 14469]|uniref:Uncharacterized protein n=1 Tax=Marvinbryantia formatexigens DSM 14469 TaxID=478749 RepID=C6LH18_9FIRM|nr:hypothetical protein BRYFOR_07928 [Marvinbryantia formatexigens DSM 14469]